MESDDLLVGNARFWSESGNQALVQIQDYLGVERQRGLWLYQPDAPRFFPIRRLRELIVACLRARLTELENRPFPWDANEARQLPVVRVRPCGDRERLRVTMSEKAQAALG